MVLGSMVQNTGAAGTFEVNGNFAAGGSESERAFTIRNDETLDAANDFDSNDLAAAFNPDDATYDSTAAEISFTQTLTTKQGRSQTSSEAGLKYKHFVPRDKTASGSTIYLPHINNVFLHEPNGTPIRLEGWIRKTFIAPLKKEIKQSQNAVRVLGALLGLDLKKLREVLTFDRETVALVESIKTGAVPVFIPGDLFVAKTAEINTDEDAEKPSFCDAFSGAGGTSRGTSQWILEEIMGFGASSGASRRIRIKTVDKDASATGNNQRWDNSAAFTADAGTRGNSGNAANPYANNANTEFKGNVDNKDGTSVDLRDVFGETQTGGFDRSNIYDETVIDAFEEQVDACSGS